MEKKIGGWHRIWILLSVIYFFVVAGFAVYIYPQHSSEAIKEISREKVLETIELTLPKHKEPTIKMLMNYLHKMLARGDKTAAREWVELRMGGIEIDRGESPLSFGPSKSYSINLSKGWREKPLKTLKFTKNANPSKVVAKVEKNIREFNICCDAQQVWSTLFSGLTQKEIIDKLHKEHQNVFDFSAINAKYNAKYIKKKLRELKFKFVLIAFAFWAISVIAIYLLVYSIVVSIRWVIRGFRVK